MSFRRRIAIASAAAVAIAVVLASVLIYVLTSDQLHSQVDNQLRNRGLERSLLLRRLEANGEGGRRALLHRERLRIAEEGELGAAARGNSDTRTDRRVRPRGSSARSLFSGLSPGPDQVRGYQQVVNASGRIVERSPAVQGISLPVQAQTRALATRGGEPFMRDANVDGIHLRVLAEPLGRGHAVQFAQSLTEVDGLLGRLRLILLLVLVGGIALAALLGRLVAGAAVLPLKRLTQATEHVAQTRDLSGRIEPSGEDEIGRLASSFNAMLDALERSVGALDASVHAQRQLVADASHELRTPVTSLRTNIEILQQQGQEMDVEDSRRLLADVVEQIEELTLLMNDLIDLARGEEPRADTEDVRLDLLVSEVIERARKHAPATPLWMELQPTIVPGVPARLERAIANLIDNAVKYSPPGEPVEVRLVAGVLTVRDHGPGISTEDLPHIFDRFYRGAEARGRPGSGLGLAIVRQVAAQHHGSISVERAPGGGTVMRLRLLGAEAAESIEGDGPHALTDPAELPARSPSQQLAG
ncbi:MAG TPA: HAMP domain-containing sensor histidine kinase [Solirubrobacteraceae bacterium]|nr:HAMP domain-containing sensor histidine kinase [Solirubrobacteraceae bacterium]